MGQITIHDSDLPGAISITADSVVAKSAKRAYEALHDDELCRNVVCVQRVTTG